MANDVIIHIKGKDDASKVLGGVEKKASGLGKALKNVTQIAGGFMLAKGIMQAPQIIGGMMKSAQQLELQMKKVSIVFGDQVGIVKKWAAQNAASMGLTKRATESLAAGLGDLLIPMGFTRAEAAGMSTDIVGLSGALAEWSGGTYDAAGVADILNKALLGERESLKSLGISITEADVKARLLRNGTDELTGAQLQQAKASATQELLFEKSTDAQAAFAEGADGAARKQSELSAKIAEVKEALALKLAPAFSELIGFILTRAIPALEDLKTKFVELGDSAAVQFFKDFGETVIPGLVRSLQTLSDFLSTHRDLVYAVIAAYAAWHVVKISHAIIELAGALSIANMSLMGRAGLIGGLTLLGYVAGLYLGQRWPELWGGVVKVTEVSVNGIIRAINKIIDALNWVLEQARKIPFADAFLGEIPKLEQVGWTMAEAVGGTMLTRLDELKADIAASGMEAGAAYAINFGHTLATQLRVQAGVLRTMYEGIVGGPPVGPSLGEVGAEAARKMKPFLEANRKLTDAADQLDAQMSSVTRTIIGVGTSAAGATPPVIGLGAGVGGAGGAADDTRASFVALLGSTQLLNVMNYQATITELKLSDAMQQVFGIGADLVPLWQEQIGILEGLAGNLRGTGEANDILVAAIDGTIQGLEDQIEAAGDAQGALILMGSEAVGPIAQMFQDMVDNIDKATESIKGLLGIQTQEEAQLASDIANLELEKALIAGVAGELVELTYWEQRRLDIAREGLPIWEQEKADLEKLVEDYKERREAGEELEWVERKELKAAKERLIVLEEEIEGAGEIIDKLEAKAEMETVEGKAARLATEDLQGKLDVLGKEGDVYDKSKTAMGAYFDLQVPGRLTMDQLTGTIFAQARELGLWKGDVEDLSPALRTWYRTHSQTVFDIMLNFNHLLLNQDTFVTGTGTLASQWEQMWRDAAAGVVAALATVSDAMAGVGVDVDVGAGNVAIGATPLAAGGIVTRPTLALLGEHGDEAVIPLGQGVMPGGDTYINEIHMHVQGSILSERDLKKVVADGMRRGEFRGAGAVT